MEPNTPKPDTSGNWSCAVIILAILLFFAFIAWLPYYYGAR